MVRSVVSTWTAPSAGRSGSAAPRRVAPVALDDLGQDLAERLVLAAVLEFLLAAAGPFLGGGVEEELHIGRRKHHGALVAALGHDVADAVGKRPLLLDQDPPDLGRPGQDNAS